MNEYPKMLYKSPGPHAIDGVMLDYCVVADKTAEAEAARDGWGSAPDAAPQVDDDRAGLEAQAEKLGIKTDGRWSDKRLADEIKAKG